MKCSVTAWILCLAVIAGAQPEDSLLIHNSQAVISGRYVGIEGSPYYFSDWVLGNVLRSDGKTVEDVWLNYNGYEHELEVRIGEDIHALDNRWHLRAEVLKEKNPKMADAFPVDRLIFQRGIQNDYLERYSTILYLGEKVTLIKDCDIGKTEKEFNDVGRTYTVQRFKDLSAYYLKRPEGTIPLKLQKKRILEAFDNNPQIGAYLEKEKPDLNNESDLVRLVRFADTL